MKKAFGLIELLLTALIIIIVYFTCFSGEKTGRLNPFDDGQELKSRQEVVDEKIQEIEKAKALREKIENNLKTDLEY